MASRLTLSPRVPFHTLIGHSAMLPEMSDTQRHTAAARIAVNSEILTPLSVETCPAISAHACGDARGIDGFSSELRCSLRPNPRKAIRLCSHVHSAAIQRPAEMNPCLPQPPSAGSQYKLGVKVSGSSKATTHFAPSFVPTM